MCVKIHMVVCVGRPFVLAHLPPLAAEARDAANDDIANLAAVSRAEWADDEELVHALDNASVRSCELSGAIGGLVLEVGSMATAKQRVECVRECVGVCIAMGEGREREIEREIESEESNAMCSLIFSPSRSLSRSRSLSLCG